VQCLTTIKFRVEFICKMYKDIKKSKKEEYNNNELKLGIDNNRYFLIGVKVEYQMN